MQLLGLGSPGNKAKLRCNLKEPERDHGARTTERSTGVEEAKESNWGFLFPGITHIRVGRGGRARDRSKESEVIGEWRGQRSEAN